MKEYITPETLAAECREYEKIKAFNPHIVVNGKLEEPYYSIDYYDITEKEWHNGFGSSCLAYVQVWLRECFEEVDCAFMEVRHGRWICINKRYGEYECSVCHGMDSNCSDYYGIHAVTEQEFCPNCGCKMDKEEADDKKQPEEAPGK